MRRTGMDQHSWRPGTIAHQSYQEGWRGSQPHPWALGHLLCQLPASSGSSLLPQMPALMEAARASPDVAVSYRSSWSLAFRDESQTYYSLPGAAFLLLPLPLIPTILSGCAGLVSAQGLCWVHHDASPSRR